MDTNKQFKKVLKERLKKIEETLSKKEKEYALKDRRYHNFDIAARMNGLTAEAALWGMVSKQIVSVMDMIYDPKTITEELVNEKIGDVINYMILLEGIMKRRLKQ